MENDNGGLPEKPAVSFLSMLCANLPLGLFSIIPFYFLETMILALELL